MVKKEVINRFQLWLLVVNFTIGSALLLIPAAVVGNAKQDAWASMLLAILLGMFLQFIMVSLANQHPDKTLIEICESLLGKYIGKAIGILYAWFFIHLAALVIRNSIDFVVTIIMPETPMITFAIIAGIVTIYAAYHGIEVFSRTNELFSFFSFIGIALTIVLVIPLMKLENLQPIFSNGVKPIIAGANPVVGFPYAELVVFLMILPYVDKRRHLKKIFLSAGALGGIALGLVTLTSVLVLGVGPTSLSIFPTYNIARLINIADFLTRVEAITALAYMFVITTKIFVAFYGGTLALSQVFKLADYRLILLPMLVIVITLSITLNANIIEEINFAITTWTPYSLIFGFVIPVFLLIITYLKKSFGKNR